MTEIINLINVYFKNIWKCHNKTPCTTSENVLKKKKSFPKLQQIIFGLKISVTNSQFP
jgi:hypothetical protein